MQFLPGGRLPPFLAERLTPAIRVDPPDTATLQAILQSHLASVDTRWIRIYLEEHWAEDLSPRRAIRALQYAWKLARQTGQAAVADDEIRACLCQPSRTREAMAGNAAPGHRNGKRNEQPPQGGTNAGKLVLPFLGKDPSKRMH